MKLTEKKKLINDIKKLDDDCHEVIFEKIIKKYPEIKYDISNNKYVFFDLDDNIINEEFLKELRSFIDRCIQHQQYVKDRELNEKQN